MHCREGRSNLFIEESTLRKRQQPLCQSRQKTGVGQLSMPKAAKSPSNSFSDASAFCRQATCRFVVSADRHRSPRRYIGMPARKADDAGSAFFLEIFLTARIRTSTRKNANGGAAKRPGFTMPRLDAATRSAAAVPMSGKSLCPDERVDSNAPRDITPLLFL